MKIVKSSCSSKRKVRTCTFSPQVNIKNKRTAVQTEQDVNAAHSEAKLQDLINDIKSNIYTKVKAVATSPEFGFDENEVDDYFFVETSATEIGEDHHEAIRVEVRGEVSYEGLEDLMEALNPIIESYDSYAYFEPVEPGIIEAYVSVNQIDMSIYGATASPDHMFYDYHGKRFSIHDNSSEIGEDSIDDVYFLWKGDVSQQAGAYNDADEDYVYAFIRGRGVIEYYKKGKYVATDNYTLRDEDDFEYAWEYMEIILQHICDRLIAYNKDVPDRMVHNSTDVLAASLQDPIDLDNLPDDFVQAYLAAKEDFESAYGGAFAEASLVDDSESNDDEVCAIVEGTDVKGKPVSGKVYLYKYTDNYDVIFQALDETADAIGLNDDLKDAVESAYDFKTSENYKGRRIKLLNDGTGYAIFEKGEMIDYGFKSLEDAEAAVDEYDDVYQDDIQVYSATDDDGEGYWFFTTHGAQPGSVPRDVDILDIIDTPNGAFVKFDRFLSTEELNEYDMVEKAPKSVMSSKNCEYVKSSEEDEDREDLPMVDQEYDSAATSINSNKLPAIYKMVNFNEGDVVVDFGGGKFDNAVEYIRDKGATLCVYDPYNRSAEHNKEVLRILRENGGADAAVNSNVLNVIKEPEARKNVLENIARITKPGAPIYITVYEGKGDGQEGPTKSGYQLNRKTADYLEEIQEVFPDATRKGKLITAHNSGVSAATNTANIGAKITCSDKYDTTWIKLAQKQVPDFDGFYTDYTMYISDDGTSYIFMFGDEDIYGPDPEYADYECSDWNEASEWWNDYNGFEDDNSLNDIQSSSSTDVTGSISAEEFFTKDDLIEFAISVEDEINRRINPKKKFNVSDAYVDGRNIHIELHNDEYELSGEVSVDMRSIRRPSDIHKYLKPVVDEIINQYNEYRVDGITASTVLDMNPEFRNNFEEAVDFFYEDYPATVELTDEVDEDYDTLYKAYVKETGSLYQQTPGIVYIDINWDSGEILQALQETAEAIGIEQYTDNIESSESVEGDTFSQLEDQYLSPPEYDDPIEHEDSQELIEVELDQVITVDVDGDYEWDDDTYVWASPDGSNEEWRSEDGVYIDDKVGVVEHIDDLITPNVPTRPGKYRVTGLAKLIYDVSGIQEYRTNYGPDDYESDIDTDHAVVAFNFSQSTVENLKITPVRR